MGADLLYAQKGFTHETPMSTDQGVDLGEKTSRYNYDYLTIPIKAGYKMGGRLKGSANVGFVPSILIKNEIIFPTADNNPIKYTTKEVNLFDFAGLVELMAEYELNTNLILFTSLSYQQSFYQSRGAEALLQPTNQRRPKGQVPLCRHQVWPEVPLWLFQ